SLLLLESFINGNLIANFGAYLAKGMISKLNLEKSASLVSNLTAAVVTGLEIFIGPIIAISFALLYFKARQGTGDTLKEALGQFGEETPRSKWQLQMRDRIRMRSRLTGRTTL